MTDNKRGSAPGAGPRFRFEGYPATVPQTVQKRAPAGSGEPQPPHGPADLRAIGAASALRAGRGGGGAVGAPGVPPTGVAGVVGTVAAAGLPVVVAPGAALTITGTGAISELPHDGQTTQDGSSTILRQVRQRLGANGSAWPQNGHAATDLSMNLSQYGQGCLKVGIVRSYQPKVPEGMDFFVEVSSAAGAAESAKSPPAAPAVLSLSMPASPASPSSPPASPICDS